MKSLTEFPKNSLPTFTGKIVNLLDPDVTTIYPVDIAVGLARQCRFGGHTKDFYSVAEHSDWCRQQCDIMYPGDTRLQFVVMMHDAHEYILGDIPTPLKMLIPEYNFIAANLQDAIHRRFGIHCTRADEAIINEIDKMALDYEWENKLHKRSGLRMHEKTVTDIFIHHFVKLCKTPFALQ